MQVGWHDGTKGRKIPDSDGCSAVALPGKSSSSISSNKSYIYTYDFCLNDTVPHNNIHDDEGLQPSNFFTSNSDQSEMLPMQGDSSSKCHSALLKDSMFSDHDLTQAYNSNNSFSNACLDNSLCSGSYHTIHNLFHSEQVSISCHCGVCDYCNKSTHYNRFEDCNCSSNYLNHKFNPSYSLRYGSYCTTHNLMYSELVSTSCYCGACDNCDESEYYNRFEACNCNSSCFNDNILVQSSHSDSCLHHVTRNSNIVSIKNVSIIQEGNLMYSEETIYKKFDNDCGIGNGNSVCECKTGYHSLCKSDKANSRTRAHYVTVTSTTQEPTFNKPVSKPGSIFVHDSKFLQECISIRNIVSNGSVMPSNCQQVSVHNSDQHISNNILTCKNGCTLSDNTMHDCCGFSPHNTKVAASFIAEQSVFGVIQHSREPNIVSHDLHNISGDGINWLIQARAVIYSTGMPNYMKARVPVKSDFNIENWEFWLAGFDDRLIDFLRFGFPLCISHLSKSSINVENHASASKFPKQVLKFFDDEIAHSAMLGPFNHNPLNNLQVSPLMSRDKSDGSKRIIVDLSFPPGKSVNDRVSSSYDTVNFTLKYPSVDMIARRIIQLGDTAMLCKVDLKRAFRNLRVDPADVHNLGLRFDGKFFIDLSIPFGYKHGSVCCQRVTDAVREICRKNGYWVWNYIDDFHLVESSDKIFKAFEFFTNLLKDLGLPINHDKTVQPCKALTCIGIRVDASLFTLSIDPQKLKEIFQACRIFLSYTTLTRQKLQSILGKLIYISKCVPAARIFVCRLLNILRSAPKHGRFKLNNDYYRDLVWFLSTENIFQGRVFIKSNRRTQTLFVDACLLGLGGICLDQVYTAQVPSYFRNLGIVQLEMVNVFVALQLWGTRFKGHKIFVHCDNYAVVHILN